MSQDRQTKTKAANSFPRRLMNQGFYSHFLQSQKANLSGAEAVTLEAHFASR